ncbi:Fic family protein [Rhodobacteraceae bacterium R_SAG3]|nr:Fic family protein [Rhodobacteraceae bacterium R_SAG3]
MILYDLTSSEAHPAYQALAISNGDRQFSFLRSIVSAAIEAEQPFLSQAILKALNFHAIACLHTNAGQYRPCEVHVTHPDPTLVYQAPQQFRVQALMDNFVNVVNLNLGRGDPIWLASFVLWRLCSIHPFINGNGRTARAACYFTLCLKAGGWLPGTENVTTLLKSHADYTTALKAADASLEAGALDLAPVMDVVRECVELQLASAAPPISEGDDS